MSVFSVGWMRNLCLGLGSKGKGFGKEDYGLEPHALDSGGTTPCVKSPRSSFTGLYPQMDGVKDILSESSIKVNPPMSWFGVRNDSDDCSAIVLTLVNNPV